MMELQGIDESKMVLYLLNGYRAQGHMLVQSRMRIHVSSQCVCNGLCCMQGTLRGMDTRFFKVPRV